MGVQWDGYEKVLDELGEERSIPMQMTMFLQNTNDIPRPSSSGVQLALFADDTALFYGSRNRITDSPSSLQRAIDELVNGSGSGG
ncbi:hypothetical protein EVAR_51421_1 [Eumeta japonica]|uniref:Reverse transcriptase domain-containing protein n=1 Tax=Eumeta variegata TaxID=151549 RepID=A0A4C1XW38_EUMVA|nr:hypothetical protein EVAR_51421_1 [Eumeta japonica]